MLDLVKENLNWMQENKNILPGQSAPSRLHTGFRLVPISVTLNDPTHRSTIYRFFSRAGCVKVKQNEDKPLCQRHNVHSGHLDLTLVHSVH